MRYISVNEYGHFNYHDAEIKKMTIQDHTLTWILSELNATKENSQNDYPEDMCIKECVLLFENFRVEEIVFSALATFDVNNRIIESVQARKAESSEIDGIIESMMNSYNRIQGFEEQPVLNDGRHVVCFEIDSTHGYFDLTISMTTFVAQWDEYSKKAWYEENRWKNRDK